MDIKKLEKWWSTEEYDPEDKELNRIITFGKIKGKNILIIGIYGVMHISFKLQKYVKSIMAIHNNKDAVDYCKNKDKKINFQIGNISELGLPEKTFDTIILPWSGLHYKNNKSKIIKELKRVLKPKGILLIEEADETSEYVKVLNLIVPKRKLKIKEKRTELKNILKKNFKVIESKLTTYYYFKNKNRFKKYFKNEIIYHENKKFTKSMSKILDKYISNKKSLKVEEKSIFFVCKKI